MRFGLALPSFAYDDERVKIIDWTLRSLAKTNVEGLERPVLDITHGVSAFSYEPYMGALSQKFEARTLPDPPDIRKPDRMHYIVTASALRLLNDHPDVTHICCLVDDYIYNPEWLHQLEALIARHPTETRAWSVFRSRYTEYHRIVGGDGVDVLMSMHDSIGCMTREEMFEFCKNGYVAAPDIGHAQQRPGPRWATSRDYMENVGRHVAMGIADVDCAIDFVGE
jgi:hypothetical protein